MRYKCTRHDRQISHARFSTNRQTQYPTIAIKLTLHRTALSRAPPMSKQPLLQRKVGSWCRQIGCQVRFKSKSKRQAGDSDTRKAIYARDIGSRGKCSVKWWMRKWRVTNIVTSFMAKKLSWKPCGRPHRNSRRPQKYGLRRCQVEGAVAVEVTCHASLTLWFCIHLDDSSSR